MSKHLLRVERKQLQEEKHEEVHKAEERQRELPESRERTRLIGNL